LEKAQLVHDTCPKNRGRVETPNHDVLAPYDFIHDIAVRLDGFDIGHLKGSHPMAKKNDEVLDDLTPQETEERLRTIFRGALGGLRLS
jgi:hypothetical protein